MKSASLALEPLMLAERDREYLKQLRRNRDAEEKLMADVEGWEVGTFYGHKVYKVGLEFQYQLSCEVLEALRVVKWLKNLLLFAFLELLSQ